MARAYSAIGPDAGGAAPQTAVTIVAAATVRPRLFDAVFGSAIAPADQAAMITITRFTAAGTTAASPPTPLAVDPGDVAALSTVGWTHSAEPTYATPDLFRYPLNQRATFRYVASPGYELVAPATAANGLGVRRFTSTANYAVTATVLWTE